MAAQATDEERRAVATHLVDNRGDLASLARRVDEIWAELTGATPDEVGVPEAAAPE
jgi:dephospho-CoA kinase